MKYYKTRDNNVCTTTNFEYTQEQLIEYGLTEITQEEYNSLQNIPKSEQEILIDSINQEMSEIKQWLNENDYIINKHLLGEYSDDNQKWTTYLEERKEKLARYNELEKILK